MQNNELYDYIDEYIVKLRFDSEDKIKKEILKSLKEEKNRIKINYKNSIIILFLSTLIITTMFIYLSYFNIENETYKLIGLTQKEKNIHNDLYLYNNVIDKKDIFLFLIAPLIFIIFKIKLIFLTLNYSRKKKSIKLIKSEIKNYSYNDPENEKTKKLEKIKNNSYIFYNIHKNDKYSEVDIPDDSPKIPMLFIMGMLFIVMLEIKEDKTQLDNNLEFKSDIEIQKFENFYSEKLDCGIDNNRNLYIIDSDFSKEDKLNCETIKNDDFYKENSSVYNFYYKTEKDELRNKYIATLNKNIEVLINNDGDYNYYKFYKLKPKETFSYTKEKLNNAIIRRSKLKVYLSEEDYKKYMVNKLRY